MEEAREMTGKTTEERKIPRTMSTQHPDNARVPLWCKGEVIDGDDEIYEACIAYSDFGCQEVMWDSEGKDADTHVVRKLLTNYEDFFRENIIGRDFFLTYRIPNPKVELAERKIVAETLGSLPVSHDVALSFYGREATPIFEVILPFTTHSRELLWLFNYYKRAIVEVGNIRLDEVTRIKDWVGSFKPEEISVIPLVEDFESLQAIDEIVEPYIDVVQPKYLRAFIARSDPALNYGLVCAVILSKIALSKLKSLEEKKDVAIFPILGVGSMPFRGHLSPDNLKGFLAEYKGVYTVTIQSALKYDYPPEEAKKVVKILNDRLPYGEPVVIEPHEEKILSSVLAKFKSRYQGIVEGLAPLINSVASYVPKRRGRKLHIGLFGYSRNVRGMILPRAIPFAGALYSLGVPPEFIGLKALSDLSENEYDVLKDYHTNLGSDLDFVACYLSRTNIDALVDMYKMIARRAGMEEEKLRSALTELLLDIKTAEEQLGVKIGPKSPTHRRYESAVSNFLISYIKHEDDKAREYFIEAARIRRCIG